MRAISATVASVTHGRPCSISRHSCIRAGTAAGDADQVVVGEADVFLREARGQLLLVVEVGAGIEEEVRDRGRAALAGAWDDLLLVDQRQGERDPLELRVARIRDPLRAAGDPAQRRLREPIRTALDDMGVRDHGNVEELRGPRPTSIDSASFGTSPTSEVSPPASCRLGR